MPRAQRGAALLSLRCRPPPLFLLPFRERYAPGPFSRSGPGLACLLFPLPRPPIRPGPYCGAPSSPPFPQSQPLTTTCRPQTPERGSGRSRSPPEPLAAGPGPALRRLLAAHSRLGPFQAQASPRRLIRAPRPGGSRFPPEPCPTPGLWAISPIIRSVPGSRGRVGPGGEEGDGQLSEPFSAACTVGLLERGVM